MKDGCGRSLPESFAFLSRDLSCWKMSQVFDIGDLATFSGTWPKAATMRNGTVYRQQPLVPRISGNGCSLWPTPDGHAFGVSDPPESFLARREREKAKNRNGNGFGLTLGMAVQLLPTPTSSLAEKKGADYARRNRAGGGRGPDLQTYAIMYPTPQAGAQNPAAHNAMSGDFKTKLCEALEIPITGKLNPQFVEWLMGFPIGWTDLDA